MSGSLVRQQIKQIAGLLQIKKSRMDRCRREMQSLRQIRERAQYQKQEKEQFIAETRARDSAAIQAMEANMMAAGFSGAARKALDLQVERYGREHDKLSEELKQYEHRLTVAKADEDEALKKYQEASRSHEKIKELQAQFLTS